MFLFLLSLACGPKKETQTSTPPSEENTSLEKNTPEESNLEEDQYDEVPEPPPAPTFPSNVDFQVTLHFADSSTKSGHVFRMERSEKFEGTEDRMWFEDESNIFIPYPWNVFYHFFFYNFSL